MLPSCPWRRCPWFHSKGRRSLVPVCSPTHRYSDLSHPLPGIDWFSSHSENTTVANIYCRQTSNPTQVYMRRKKYIYRVSQKKGNPFYQWDIFIVAQVFIELYASCSRAFSILSFDTKHMTISQYMTEKEQFELMHVKIELRRIMVLSWYDQVQTS